MSDPKLSARCLEAAQVLEEMGQLYGFLDPSRSEWSAVALRTEAEHVEEDGL